MRVTLEPTAYVGFSAFFMPAGAGPPSAAWCMCPLPECPLACSEDEAEADGEADPEPGWLCEALAEGAA
ncbi:hypothetical protein GCM10009595_09920 [Falsarthrobacter nasiphocae]